jgi:hypothetical protein
MKSAAVLAVVALLATPVLGGPVYKWTDARGVVHFGDVPPHAAGVNAETMPPAPPPVARPPQEAEATPADAAAAAPAADGEHGEGPARVAITDRDDEPLGPSVHAFRGKVKNQGGSEARDVSVAIVVNEPTQGEECLREEIDVEPSTLAPGAVGTYEAEFDNPCFHGDVAADLRPEWR